MSSYILPQQVKDGQHTHPGGAGVITRAERTPGEVAVSGGVRQTSTGGGVNSLPVLPQTNSFPSLSAVPLPLPTIPRLDSLGYVQLWTSNRELVTSTRIVGFGKLRNLLQPKHKYFEDKWGKIQYWQRYLDEKEGFDLVFPRVKTWDRGNPFRRYQLNRQCAARSGKAVLELADSLSGFRVIDIETTMPKAVSRFLAGKQEKGRDMAWGINSRFWEAMVDGDLVGVGCARRSNLHVWSTECPLEPQFHFHELVPNYEQVNAVVERKDLPDNPCSKCGRTIWVKDSKGWFCENCSPAFAKPVPVLNKREWQRQHGGMLVPFDDKQMFLVKALWLEVQIEFVRKYRIEGAWDCQHKLLKFQRRYGVKGLVRLISFLGRFNKGLVDVYVSFVKLNNSIGMAKFIHKLGYNGRHWEEDYAFYSNKNPDCDNPPEWLLHYENKARVFGWWRDIKLMVKLSPDKEKSKLSPYNAGKLNYLGRYSTSELLENNNMTLVGMEMIKGSPFEWVLKKDDLEWLQQVDIDAWRQL